MGPNFAGAANYIKLLGSDMLKYAGNTLLLWLIGFIPQIVVALVLAQWFVDTRLKIRGSQFFKVILAAIVPIIIVYLLLSKFIIAGVTLGGVKE